MRRGRRPGGENTRALILEAARTEFAATGYDGTSIRGVARTAVSIPASYTTISMANLTSSRRSWRYRSTLGRE